MIGLILKSGAIFLQSKGDEIFGFFDVCKNKDPYENCLTLFRTLNEESNQLAKIFKIQGTNF